VSYRVNRGLGFDRAAMGVVVQWLVPADASAVAFTRNPVNGSDDEVLICATNGLGEPLVSGQVTPDTIVIDKDTLSASQVEAGEKGVQLVARGGGVERLAIADDTALALDTRSALALTELCLRVEDLAGEPMDVEAALLGDRWYLLQARPVTASIGT
jgi:pyruvate,water dikinase